MIAATGDTIVAISSATGAAARMIVRFSGPGAYALLARICLQTLDEGRQLTRQALRFADLSINAWIYRFRAPRSFTGEDLVELHIPGNPLLARILIEELVRLGARQAEAGEFTARAYFNGRIDLTAAEGIAAAVTAHGEAELLAARQLLAGELANRLRPIMDDLAQTLALVEAGIDFSDEDITFLDAPQVAQAARRAEQSLAGLLNESPRFERLSHEPRIVLVGRPNAGKSTLLNLLSESTRAVVSPRAGTTRDVIHADAVLDRGIVHIVDAAGLEDRVDSDADDSPRAQIARQMHQRSLAEVQRADAVVLLVECDDPRPMLDLRRDPDLVVMTKVDRSHDSLAPPNSDSGRISISAHSGAGIDLLKQRLSSLAFGQDAPGSALALNSRHREAIGQAMASLARAKDVAVSATPELLALELRDALDALGRILGQMTPDDVLGRVFATFCIGK